MEIQWISDAEKGDWMVEQKVVNQLGSSAVQECCFMCCDRSKMGRSVTMLEAVGTLHSHHIFPFPVSSNPQLSRTLFSSYQSPIISVYPILLQHPSHSSEI